MDGIGSIGVFGCSHAIPNRSAAFPIEVAGFLWSLVFNSMGIHMFRKVLPLFVIFAAASLISGCSNLADARSAKGTGLSREYSATADATWKAVPEVLQDMSLPLVTENRPQGYILAQRGLSAFSYGENVAIFIDSVAGSVKTKVEVVSKKALATTIFAPDWSKRILDALEKKLTNSSPAAAEVAATDSPEKR